MAFRARPKHASGGARGAIAAMGTRTKLGTALRGLRGVLVAFLFWLALAARRLPTDTAGAARARASDAHAGSAP